jgi:hypothetical protein
MSADRVISLAESATGAFKILAARKSIAAAINMRRDKKINGSA